MFVDGKKIKFVFIEKNFIVVVVIFNVMKEWEESFCLKFVRRKSEKNYIEFFKGLG